MLLASRHEYIQEFLYEFMTLAYFKDSVKAKVETLFAAYKSKL